MKYCEQEKEKSLMAKKILIRPILYASKVEYMSLIPEGALQILQTVMEYGEKRGKNNQGWNESVEHHLNRIVLHIKAYRQNDKNEDHLGHIFARAMLANAINEKQKKTGIKIRK